MILAVTAILSLWSGCGDDGSVPDGGTAEGGARDGGSSTGTVRLHFEAETESGIEVETALIQVSRVRARNDRGGDFEPERDGVGVVDLQTDNEVDLAPAVPATYGRVTVQMAPDGSNPTLLLIVRESERTLHIEIEREVSLDARCATATVLEPGGIAQIDLILDLPHLLGDLDEPSLPDPEDGVIQIDEESAPEAAAAIADELGSRWNAVCDSVDGETAELRSGE